MSRKVLFNPLLLLVTHANRKAEGKGREYGMKGVELDTCIVFSLMKILTTENIECTQGLLFVGWSADGKGCGVLVGCFPMINIIPRPDKNIIMCT